MLLPHCLDMKFPHADQFVRYTGMSPEGSHIWTNGNVAELHLQLPVGQSINLTFLVAPFIWPPHLSVQPITIFIGNQKLAEWICDNHWARAQTLPIPGEMIPLSGELNLRFEVPNATSPKSLGINSDGRELGICFWHAGWSFAQAGETLEFGRRTGTETRKSYDLKILNGFWAKYIAGSAVLDIGFSGYEAGIETIVPGAIGVDVDYPGYDGRTLPFETESQDAVFSSHCLEHIPDYIQAIQEWHRVTKIGGHIIIVVPHAWLYERRARPPSRWNGDHRRFYTAASLLSEVQAALIPNSYRIRHLVENDWRYNYSAPIDQHPGGCYEIELVLEKIPTPEWVF